MNPPTPTLAWLEPDQVPLVRQIAELAGLSIQAAGSSSRGRAADVASRFDVPPYDDLRAALVSCSLPLVLLASTGDFGALPDSTDGDLEALASCRARSIKVATLEPIPASPLQIATRAGGLFGPAAPAPEFGGPGSPELARFIPLARLSSPMLDAAEVLSSFGPIRSVVIQAFCNPAEGSLGARLYDALDTAGSMLGLAEHIDASCVVPAADSPASTRRSTADTLRYLSGDMTINLRFPDGRAASIAISNHAARWNRALTLLGPGGRLTVYDDGFEWLAPDGNRLDASRGLGSVFPSATPAPSAQPPSPADKPRRRSKPSAATPPEPPPAPAHARSAPVIADALARFLDGRQASSGHVDARTTLAMAGAALLSARTGEAEDPATILRMSLPAG